jgi:2-keto-myo-inositol isomerase
MRLAFHGATTMTSNLQTDVAVSAQAGFKALELWATKVDTFLNDHSVADLQALLQDNKVAPMTFNSIEFIAFRGNEFDQIKARCRQLSQLGQAIGCPSVAVIPSPAPTWNTPWDTIVTEHVAALQELSDIAAEYDMKLAFEFIGFGGFSVRTPRGAMEIIQQTGRDNIGLVIDACHFYIGGGSLSEIEQLDPKYIYAFHLDDTEDLAKERYTDAKRLLPGLGVIPLDEICQRLQGIGYDGPCSIELFRPEYWAWNPLEVAVKARAAAIEVLSPYFEVQ